MGENALTALSRRYPQLLLPIEKGASQTEEYRDTVLRGKPTHRLLRFRRPDAAALKTRETPAGTAEILFLPEREDFLHAYRALGCRCEPAEIPDSVGAGIVSGLTDWEKIRKHRAAYEAGGHRDWPAEFRRFTGEKANFRGTLILLGSGPYSALSAGEAGLPPEDWLNKSLIIREYHELCHFVCRGLWPEKKQPLRDEIYADAVGLLAAFGTYDEGLAKRFLGIEGQGFRPGGRLSHYAEENLPAAAALAGALTEEAKARIASAGAGTIWETLGRIY